MKINKKVNCNKITALSSYLFLGILAIFIGLGAGLCLANTANVNDFNSLEEAVGNNNISTINVETDYIKLGGELSNINHSLAIYGKANGSILDGNNAHRIFEFAPNSGNITIDSIHFQNGRNEDPLNINNGGGAVHIEKGTNIAFINTNFSNNKATSNGGAIFFLGDAENSSTLTFSGMATFTSNESTSGHGGAIYTERSDLAFSKEVKFEKNRSSGNGGAIYFDGDAGKKNSLTFNSKVIFTNNESTNGKGGAIYAWHSNLT
ncbi:MAG: hypothetical protein LBP39_03250, partial [Rickettsiales bacterium]|nr:hypothetical protein [Rickettsiales bacterium]